MSEEFPATLFAVVICVFIVLFPVAGWLRRRGYSPQMDAIAAAQERLGVRVAYGVARAVRLLYPRFPLPPLPPDQDRHRPGTKKDDQWR